MLRISIMVLAATLIAAFLHSDPAHAQASRTWVSGVGDDANPCSRTAPCKTFAGAMVRVSLENNVAGFISDSSGGTGALFSSAKDSVAAGNSIDGWLATGATGATTRNAVFVDHSFGVNNGGAGAKANGNASALLFINYSVFTGNNTGVAFTNGGLLFSYKTNAINNNLVSDGVPSNFITLN